MSEKPVLPLVLARDEIARNVYRGHAVKKVGVGDGKLLPDMDRSGTSESIKEIALMLSLAQVVVWRADLLDAAVLQWPTFEGTRLPASLIPRTPQWWPAEILCQASYFADKVWQVNDATFSRDYRFLGLLLYPTINKGKESLVEVAMFVNPAGRMAQAISASHAGDVVHEGDIHCVVAACLSFMQQEFVENRRSDLSKRPAPVGQDKYVPVVNHVLLRARRSETSDKSPESTRVYEHSWAVRGHARRLATPRKKDGQEVTWVSPYVKGDPEKPLLLPRDTIVKVTR